MLIYIFIAVTAIIVFLIYAYIRLYIDIIPPYMWFVHLRKGSAIRQGEGGMVRRIPFIDNILYTDLTLRTTDITTEGKNIYGLEVRVIHSIRWCVDNPIKFIQTVENENAFRNMLMVKLKSILFNTLADTKDFYIPETFNNLVVKTLRDVGKDSGVFVYSVDLVDLKVLAIPKTSKAIKPVMKLSDIEVGGQRPLLYTCPYCETGLESRQEQCVQCETRIDWD